MIERVLFVVGPPNGGKSVQLRSMFIDWRFGREGKIPRARNVVESIRLSHDRTLYLRLTSPHEYGEAPDEWLKKTGEKTADGRWCHAGALQPEPEDKMPGLIEALRAFVDKFEPERTRLAFLSPDRQGVPAQDRYSLHDLLEKARALPGVETIMIDARSREANGLLLADFLDFS